MPARSEVDAEGWFDFIPQRWRDSASKMFSKKEEVPQNRAQNKTKSVIKKALTQKTIGKSI